MNYNIKIILGCSYLIVAFLFLFSIFYFNINFDNFSHLIEKWISLAYPLQHIEGCQAYDFIDENFPETKYDEKTFTKNGCKFCPSNMLGQGRVFDREIFEEKTRKLIFCIVSNVNFPNIKIRFVRGIELLQRYPNGIIPFREHDDLFT